MTLRDMRDKTGLSQAKLGKLAHVSPQRVAEWEAWGKDTQMKNIRDPHAMSLRTATKMADALGVSLGEFERNL